MRRFHAALLSLTAVVAWCLQKTSCCSRETLLPCWNETIFFSPLLVSNHRFTQFPFQGAIGVGILSSAPKQKLYFAASGSPLGLEKKKKKGKETPVCGEKMVPALLSGQVVHSAWLKGQRPRDQWLWHVHLWSCSCHLQCYGDRGKHVPVPPPPAGGLRWKKWQDPIRSLSEEWLSSDSSVFNPAKSFCFSWCPTIKTKVKREKN